MIQLNCQALPTKKWHVEYFTSIHWIEMLPKNPKSCICASIMKAFNLIHAAWTKWVLRLKIRILIHFFFYFFIIRLIKIFSRFLFNYFRKLRIVTTIRLRWLNFINLLMDSNLFNWFSIDNVKIFTFIRKLNIHMIACVILNFFVKSVVVFVAWHSLIEKLVFYVKAQLNISIHCINSFFRLFIFSFMTF